jgi:hypothetical protein
MVMIRTFLNFGKFHLIQLSTSLGLTEFTLMVFQNYYDEHRIVFNIFLTAIFSAATTLLNNWVKKKNEKSNN